jgi:hypothetical protein
MDAVHIIPGRSLINLNLLGPKIQNSAFLENGLNNFDEIAEVYVHHLSK